MMFVVTEVIAANRFLSNKAGEKFNTDYPVHH